MKLHNKVYRSLTGEPFKTQEINGKTVEFFYLNETPFLAQYVQKGRFYVWTSDGNNYRLVIEQGFYDKVSYFFAEEINGIWIGFLDEIGQVSKKMTRTFLIGSLLLAVAIIIVSIPLELQQYGIIASLLIVLISNMVHSSKLSKIIKEKNYKAQMEIREFLTEEGFERLLKEQDEYFQDYFKFDEEDELEEVEEDLLLAAEVVAEEVEEEIIEEIIAEEIIEEAIVEEVIAETVIEEVEVEKEVKQPVKKAPKKTTKVDYNTLTVAQLKGLARDLGLSGYSTMRKEELVALITKGK